MEIIHNHYPNRILQPEYEFRSVKLFVKKTNMYNSADNLFEEAKKKYDEIKELLNGAKDDITGASSKERQEQLKDRIEELNKNAESIYGLCLPLPNELSDQQTHDWETSKSIVGETLGNFADVTVKDVVGSVSKTLAKAVPKLSINKTVANAANASGARKPLINPGYFQDYNGSQPREFTFSWDFIPRNEEEVDQIKNIVYHLKKFTLPSSIGGVALLSPFTFDIEIGSPEINQMMSMVDVVCKSLNIDYAADGALQFLPNGMPKYIKVSMSFIERTVITANLY